MAINLARLGNITPVVNSTGDYDPIAEGLARRKATLDLARDQAKQKQDAEIGAINLANLKATQTESQRQTAAAAAKRTALTGLVLGREGALASDDSNIDLHRIAGPARSPEMQRDTKYMIDLANAGVPEDAEAYRIDRRNETQAAQDRTRKMGFEDSDESRKVADESRKVSLFPIEISGKKAEAAKTWREANKPYDNNVTPAPSGYRWKPDGSGLEAIPGGPASNGSGGKPPTEAQSQFAVYGRRMTNANKILDDVANSGFNRASSSGALNAILPNAWMSTGAQKQDQAERDFVNATLRRESGAAISPDEFKNARLQYFPRFGDSKEVIAQKARNRAIAIESFKGLSAGAWNQAGGDPTIQGDWEVVK